MFVIVVSCIVSMAMAYLAVNFLLRRTADRKRRVPRWVRNTFRTFLVAGILGAVGIMCWLPRLDPTYTALFCLWMFVFDTGLLGEITTEGKIRRY